MTDTVHDVYNVRYIIWVILRGTSKGITDFAEQFSKFKKEANFANLENMTGNGYKRKALANTNSSNSKIISKISEKSQNYEKSEKSQKFRERIRERIRKYQQSRYKWVSFRLFHCFWKMYVGEKPGMLLQTFTNMQLPEHRESRSVMLVNMYEIVCWYFHQHTFKFLSSPTYFFHQHYYSKIFISFRHFLITSYSNNVIYLIDHHYVIHSDYSSLMTS